MVEYKQLNKNYYQKIYNNGKKIRISKKEYYKYVQKGGTNIQKYSIIEVDNSIDNINIPDLDLDTIYVECFNNPEVMVGTRGLGPCICVVVVGKTLDNINEFIGISHSTLVNTHRFIDKLIEEVANKTVPIEHSDKYSHMSLYLVGGDEENREYHNKIIEYCNKKKYPLVETKLNLTSDRYRDDSVDIVVSNKEIRYKNIGENEIERLFVSRNFINKNYITKTNFL